MIEPSSPSPLPETRSCTTFRLSSWHIRFLKPFVLRSRTIAIPLHGLCSHYVRVANGMHKKSSEFMRSLFFLAHNVSHY